MRAIKPILFLALILVACGDETNEQQPRFSGETNQPIAIGFYNGLPTVEALIDGQAQTVIVDTGAPVTVLNSETAGLDDGFSTPTIEVFGLEFANATLGATSTLQVGDPACEDQPPAGYLGSNVLTPLSFNLDYRAAEIRMQGPGDAAVDVVDGNVSVSVPFELLGGGALALPTGGNAQAPATRVIVELEVEGQPATAFVDTGFSLHVVGPALMSRLPNPSRPQVCCQNIYLASGGRTPIVLTRLQDIAVGEIVLTEQPALLLTDVPTLQAISAEVGREVDLILGAPFLARVASRIDYPANTWTVTSYTSLDHVDDDLFVLPGFQYCKAADPEGGFHVQTVYADTTASLGRLVEGDRLIDVDGVDVRTMTEAEVAELLGRVPAAPRPMTFVREDGSTTTLAIGVERVLDRFDGN